MSFQLTTLDDNWAVFWHGLHSAAFHNGPIHCFIRDTLDAMTDVSTAVYMPRSDGIIDPVELAAFKASVPAGVVPIIVALCTRLPAPEPALMCAPLDDAMFAIGAAGVFPADTIPPWETRCPRVFWRGGCSGKDNFVRGDCVRLLASEPYANVKFVYRWHEGRDLPANCFTETESTIQEHLCYKYLLILDGAYIASNHMWPFASGAVPLLVTHPGNDFWFKRYLKPYVNYVPIEFDLSNLKATVQWLIANDDKACAIAAGARQFAETVFSSDFQQNHIREELQRIICSHQIQNLSQTQTQPETDTETTA